MKTKRSHIRALDFSHYVPILPANDLWSGRFPMVEARTIGARKWAAKMGWVVRTEERRCWVKVWDKHGNVTFARETKTAIFGHGQALKHCREISLALMNIFICGEKSPIGDALPAAAESGL